MISCHFHHRSLRRAAFAFIAVACLGCRFELDDAVVTPAPQQQPPMIEQARDLFVQGQYEKAYALAQRILIINPDDMDASRMIARIHAEKRRFGEAAEIAIALSARNPDPTSELLQAFSWHVRGGDLQAAEADVARAITLTPLDPRGHRAMAELLNSQGRRYEAHQYVLALARLGVITDRELLSLIDQGGPFQLVSFDEMLSETSGTLFELGKARHQYIAEGKPTQALATVGELASSLPGNPAVEAFRGRLIAETLGNEEFQAWARQLPTGIEQHPEYWSAIGSRLSRNDRDNEAVRAFGEALRLDPTDRRSLRSLIASLHRLGENEKAFHGQQTLVILDKVFRFASTPDAEQTAWIAEQLQTLVRPWESVAWYRHLFRLRGVVESRDDELNERVRQIREWERASGIEQIRDARLTKMLGFDIRDFPMPELDARIVPGANVETARPQSDLKFHDVAQAIGVKTSLISDYPFDTVDFYLYQANGAGLAALDYDLDGLCDLYVVQTGGDPNRKGSSNPNQLYRQLPGGEFGDVSVESVTADRSYGQGVCAGDVNQDGMPDLLVANIGTNVVYINQGDGTFRERSDLLIENSDRWTSSIALGDLDGDSLPEIVEVNYLDDPLIFQRRCEGRALNCTPQRFRAAADRIFRGEADGTFRLSGQARDIQDLPNYGFGVVLVNLDEQYGNDVFVSNDGDLNHLWKSIPSQSDQQGQFALTESVGIAGCSVGTSGHSQACMGIARGDFDRNGMLDLLITNFHNEPVNLFLQIDLGFFVDDALKYGLVEPSKDVLGFGAQSADFDNDGWLDLAISNGHIYDARYAGIPFRMVSQLFRGGRGAFSLQDAEVAGPYWSREHLARTLVLFDWNRDGRMDLVANHLDQPIAILQNDSDAGNWLQLELVGVTSEREATGTRVRVFAGKDQWTEWQSGGDGYMCTNEPVIHVGIGKAKMIDNIEVVWPSGLVQTLTSIEPNKRYLLVEGEDKLYER